VSANCTLCGAAEVDHMTAQLCDRCFQLELRIVMDPGLASRILLGVLAPGRRGEVPRAPEYQPADRCRCCGVSDPLRRGT
jgi:hypothetical protein